MPEANSSLQVPELRHILPQTSWYGFGELFKHRAWQASGRSKTSYPEGFCMTASDIAGTLWNHNETKMRPCQKTLSLEKLLKIKFVRICQVKLDTQRNNKWTDCYPLKNHLWTCRAAHRVYWIWDGMPLLKQLSVLFSPLQRKTSERIYESSNKETSLGWPPQLSTLPSITLWLPAIADLDRCRHCWHWLSSWQRCSPKAAWRIKRSGYPDCEAE